MVKRKDPPLKEQIVLVSLGLNTVEGDFVFKISIISAMASILHHHLLTIYLILMIVYQ